MTDKVEAEEPFDEESYVPEGTQYFGAGLGSEARAASFMGGLFALYGLARYVFGW